MEPVVEQLDEDERLRLISPGGVGRLAFTGRYGLNAVSAGLPKADPSSQAR